MQFRRKIPFELTLTTYKLRTIENSEELKQVLALRDECFNAHIDKGEFDLNGDFLIVEDLQKNKLCGTYRLTHSDFVQNFECEEDFNIQALLEKSGPKLELAWACIHPDYRNGSIVSLLWKGISEIIKIRPAKYIFGITSVKDDPNNIALIQKNLEDTSFPYKVEPLNRRSQKTDAFELLPPPLPTAKSTWRRLIPGLMRAYLMAGALICAQPSYDTDLDCYDFMTVIDVDQAADTIAHHYKL